MLFRQIFEPNLAQYAYLIGCQRTGEAIIVDPQRDIDRYMEIAAKEKMKIVAVTETHFHADYLSGMKDFAERYGTKPPEVDDPTALGIVGHGRYARKQLQALIDGEDATDAQKLHGQHVIASLNNVIGWMKIDDGVTKAERQPRVDLTRVWDAPSEFWLSTADTGWLHEVFAQAINILKTDYEDDVAMARQHAAAMTQLIEKYRNGVDADEDGAVEPAMMEGGLMTALQHAELGGFLTP